MQPSYYLSVLRFCAVSTLIFLLIACGNPIKPLPDPPPRGADKVVTETVGAGDRVYAIFTNPSTKTQAGSIPAVRSIGTSPSVSSRSVLDAPEAFEPPETEPRIIDLRLWEADSIDLFKMMPAPAPRHGSPPPAASLSSSPSFATAAAPLDTSCTTPIGTGVRFYGVPQHLPNDPDTICTDLKKSITDGGITLNIYVDQNDRSLITQTMVDAMADSFLKTGPNNDIYNWLTNIYGEPWGSAADQFRSSSLLPSGFKNHISILLYDINKDGRPGELEPRTVGYFSIANNFKCSTGAASCQSNERLMFAMDSELFALKDDGKTTWSVSHSWPQNVLSTLAHEFQHMIHFYQKNIVNNKLFPRSQTWLNEMASEVAQDIIADKMKVPGPRGILVDKSSPDYSAHIGYSPFKPLQSSRIGNYNARMDTSLTTWSGSLSDYGAVYAFGAYLARNYGGAELFREIVQNPYTDERAVLEAVKKTNKGLTKTFEKLLIEWAKAVLSSNKPADSQTYNFSGPRGIQGIKSTLNSIDYRLGSINFYNYFTYHPSLRRRGPLMYGTISKGAGPSINPGPSSNTIFLIWENRAPGTYQWRLTIPEGMTATLYRVKAP